MWALPLTLAACLLAGGRAYFFESGYTHHYTYKAENDLLGQGNITTILKFQVSAVNETENGHRLHSLTVDSLVQFMKGGPVMNNPHGWDLTKTFLFVVDDTGGVRLVHCHPEDHEELLVIKKAMVSVFSVHVKIKYDEKEWVYKAEETDHLGRLEHSYRAQRTATGLKLERNFSSFDDAHRFHEKTLHYDHHGTLHKAETKDRVHLKDRLPPPEKTTGLPGIAPHRVNTSGAFPEIEASATVFVQLDSKRRVSASQAVFHNLSAQTLETKPKREIYRLQSVMFNISRDFDCIERYPEKDDVNRSLCINDLRNILRHLPRKEYKQFVGRIFSNGCQDNDTTCKDRYLILIDIVARIGDVTSQELVLAHILTKKPPVSEELRRVFIHCVALERPIQKFVRAIEGFCFGETGEHHGSRNMTRTQSRACLAVGSLTRNLATGGRHTLANTLATRLETWLEEHGKGDHVISKRDTWLTDTEHEDHHISKAVLLHALGNAALTRSRRHLLDHAQPNRGHHVWRRAALDALRHYKCKESAVVLLDCLLKDEKHSVRQMALSVYATHPKRGEVTREKEDMHLSRNYTYPAVARVKRDIFETALLKLKIELPKLDWKKELGTRDVGASFGIYFNNYIHILFKVLSGYVDVNAEDKLWAEIHLGIINKQWDIIRVDACYRGRLKYNMNIVKDFTAGMAEDISSAFDHVINRIIEPIEKAANDLASKYQDPDTKKPKSGFDAMAQAVKNLPKKMQDALQSSINVTKATEALSGLPLVTKIQQLAGRAQSLMEDVHSEATDLYNNIKEAAVVGLPFAEKEIRASINTVLDKLGDVSKAPRQVFSFVERAQMSYQLAMQRILEGSNVIKQATSFLSGTRSTFMNAGEELQETMETLKHLVERLKADHARRKREANPFDEFTQELGTHMDEALGDLYGNVDGLQERVLDALDSAQELQAGSDKQAVYVEVLKASFEGFKEAIDMIKSRINALFGQKFHPKFPDQRRDCDSSCGCGYYTGECRYGHPGVDLKWEPAWTIYSPVAGMMLPTKDPNSVLIRPATAGFTDYEIILSNIILNRTLSENETYVDAGQPIGTPAGANGCEDSHFHLAMKRNAPDSANGLCYYVDPSPFLDRMQPVPKWEEECKHFTFKHIFSTIDFAKLTEGFAEILEELKRIALDIGKQLLVKIVQALPDTGLLGPMKGIALDLVRNIDLDPANLKNLFKDGVNHAKKFFKNISTGQFSLGNIGNMMKGAGGTFGIDLLSKSLSSVKSGIGQAINFIKNPKLGKLGSFSTGGIGRLLSSRGLLPGLGKLDFGGLSGLTKKISSLVTGRKGLLSMLKASPPNLCPMFGKALSAAMSQSTCVPHEDCLGIDCDIDISASPFVKGKIDVTVRVDPEEREVRITSNGQENIVKGNGSQTIGGITVLNFIEVRFAVKAEWQGKELRFTLIIHPCAAPGCLDKITLMKEIQFDSKARQKRSTDELLGEFLGNMENLPIDEVTKMFADFNFDMDNIADQVNGIQGSIAEALTTNEDQAEPTMKSEFVNPLDHKDKGKFPVKDEDGSLYVPFFVFGFDYKLGPCGFVMKFDAGGAFGVSFDVNVQALDSQMKAVFTPWVSGKLRAELSLHFIIGEAGIKLTGYVMRTSFPLTIETKFRETPVQTTKRLEIELIPLELKLKAYLKILFVINVKRTIWHWRADPIRGTIWEKKDTKNDRGPPRFQYCDKVEENCSGRRRRQIRATGSSCSVVQVANRHPFDAAFKLEFSVDDDDSDLKLWYAIGDYPGGTNLVDWTEMRGASLLAPAVLPCGIPLHFLVKARNTQGLETTARCSIPTFDCTFPDGRVEAAYRCTSHPGQISGTVVVHEDSPLKQDSLFHGVGYSPSSYGHEVVDWLPLTLSNSQPQPGVSGDLRYFSSPRAGRLTSTPKRSLSAPTASGCASQCLKMSTCVSFSYNKYLYDCELQEFTEGASAERKHDGHFVTYERLGKSFTAILRYENLPLRHGTRYYVNVDVQNWLGYRATLTSEGTMVDFTPPEPGPVGDVLKDEMTADGCTVSVIQRCVDHVTSSLNHRTIVDGEGSSTVFNGNRKGQELTHTIENYHASVNWNGFKDEECGIHGYTFAVGSTVCGTDVASFRDPHAHIHNPDDWHFTGLAKDLHLADGQYYVTVQAVNDVIHGGDLVTTVCHSAPFAVDTSPPLLNSVNEILFDETFRYLVVYYNASDVFSGVARMEFGLGITKYDVNIRRFLTFEMRGVGGNTYLVNEEFETADGVPAWIRLKVVNNVGLSETGSSDAPIIIDSTPPIPGHVMDGTLLGQDVCCQNGTTEICAQWVDFNDPDSNIESYIWGVGLIPGQDDVVPFHILSAYDKQSCTRVQLQHNTTYFSTVIANNKALNQKSSNATSNGVLVDITPPIPGNVSDGDDVINDIDFTSETATITTTWSDFQDPESGLTPYSLSVFVNQQLDKVFTDINAETFTDHSLSIQHGDSVYAVLLATNRAGGSVSVASDGMYVDHTPPDLLYISTDNQTQYQTRDDVLHFIWQFEDPESGVAEYRCVISEQKNGGEGQFWPEDADSYVIYLNSTSPTYGDIHLHNLQLENGAAYSLIVTAVNHAKMATTEQSESVTVDTTPPDVLRVSLARPDETEETNDDDEVEHAKEELLWVTWDPHDAESGIERSQICVGLAGSNDCLPSHTITMEGFLLFTASFKDKGLTVSTDDKVLYQVYVVVTNGAGVQSKIAASKPFLVLKANIPGVVLDGSNEEDIDFSHDMAAISIAFHGFSSEACGIVGYEWGVGTTPFATDVLPYSDFGLVVDDQGNGFAEAHVTQFEGQTYYSTVRAITGHNCHEEYIVSSSDGFTLDTTPPSVTFHVGTRQVTSNQVVYQTQGNTLEVVWESEDASGINETRLTIGEFKENPKTVLVPAVLKDHITVGALPSSGDSIFSTLLITDNSGNKKPFSLPPVTFDFSPPVLQDVTCTKAVSILSSVLTCTWLSVEEGHSKLSGIYFGVGSGPTVPNLLNFTSVPLHSQQWTVDTEDFMTSARSGEFFVLIRATNAAGLKTDASVKVIHDITPPDDISVRIVTSPLPGYHDKEQKCQTSQDYVEVHLQSLNDDETDIVRVEMAVGSEKGRSDIRPFRQYLLQNGLYAMGGLGLHRGSTVYVTVRATNGVGLYTIGTSDGVVISPEPRLEVWDGPGDIDMDGQAELDVMQGRWRYSDPCPVQSVEWSLRELGGKVVIDFTSIPNKSQQFYNDSLSLENLKVYVNYVRIKDALNRTFTAFSDGITIMIRTPATATVRDGLGIDDKDFQEPTDQLSANWDAFGDTHSTLPSDQIVRYEVAVGTDRRYASTRTDVHSFEDIGLVTNFTFHGLNLTAKSVVYYVTVRAHSGAGSFTESSSDGIRVGFSADIAPGEVGVDRYQSSVSSIRFWWTDFVSDMVITHYYAGISTTAPPWDNSTHDCTGLLQSSNFTFDVYDLQPLEAEFLAVIEGLELIHGGTYHVTFIAEDNSGHCSAAISDEILVDTTPPVAGKITADGVNADTVLFLHSEQTVVVSLDEFPDPESGLKNVQVELFKSVTCDPENYPDRLTSLSKINAVNESRVAMRNLQLDEDFLYFVRATVTNRAGLQTTATSLPLMLDKTPPLPGRLKLGTDWTAADRTFQNETQSVSGVIALKSLSSQEGCVTEINLLAAESRDEWEAMTQEFSEDCVGFDSLGLHVVVQHNPHLTGVDRGAAQSVEMAWREGDFVFRLSPATGRSILSGIALNSPSLRPPFLPQNGLESGNQSTVCDPTVKSCIGNASNTTLESTMLADSDYGTGLSFLENDGEVKALFWAQDILQLKQTWITLDFEPSTTDAEYILRLEKSASSGQESWEISVVINGEEKAGMGGLVFPHKFVVSVFTWNIGDYVPPVIDHFQPFRASTVVRAMSVPVERRPLCSYGAPFHDMFSGIKEVWVGVSDNFSVTANVAPYRLVKSFCLPCLKNCDSICASCNGDSVSDGYNILPVSLSGLVLQAANDVLPPDNSSASNSTNSTVLLKEASNEMKQFQLPTYYLDVKVVDHSGLATKVKSVGLVVDTSPPLITSLECTDPEYEADVAILFLGNKHTVGVKWDVSEDVSSVQEVSVCIGTQPGLEDVASNVHLDPAKSEYVFENLAPLLVEDTMYFVTLEVQNEAGLTSKAWSNFTVQTAPTNMSEVSLNLPGVTVVTLSGVKVGLLQSTERLELKLDLGPDADDLDVEYFEWAIGSSRGKDDVFPQTVVGTKNTTQVAIVDGYMKRDDLTQNVSIGDYTKKNYTSDSLPDPTANKFLMEPGRCLRQKLYGVSKGHVLTAVELTPVCIKRTLDVLLEADNTTHHLWQNGSAMSLDSAPTSAESLHATVKLSKGALLAGVIEQNDLEAQYGTSASAEFSPFIVLPDPANDQTSRWLRKRLASMPGPHVFLSPIAEAEFAEDVEFNFTVPSDVDIPDDSFVMMVFWNPGTKRWETPKELCPLVTESYDKNTRVVSAQLCADVFNDQADPDAVARKRRSVDGWPHTQVEPVILGPRMVTVAVVQTSTVNLPPTVHKTSFTMLEDSGVYIFNIAYTDDEGDEVVFSLAKQPSHGIADVTEQGLVRYRPNPNFSGKDVIDVTGREELDPRALALGIVPNTVSFTITVLVSSVNDPPDIFYLPDNSNNTDITQELLVGPTAGNGINMSVLVEGNTTTQAVLGAFFFSDIDHDPVSFFDDKRLTPGADLTVEDLAADDIAKSGVKLADTSGVSGKRITLSLAEGYSGRAVYEARVKDTAGAYSMQLTLDVRVLLRPCFHGRCKPRLSTSTCLDLERSLTFDPYVCKCDLGYEGQWCETETNECATGTCSPITDCVDLIGGYRCDYNPTKLAAIIVCSLLAALLGLFALYKLKKRKSKVGVWNVPEDFELKKVGRSACDSPLPNGSRSVSDADISLTAFVVGGVGSRKPAADTEFEFFKDPLFHYNPSQNPTAVQAPIASLAPNLTLPPAVATSSTHGKPPPSTKSPAKVKAPAAKPKPTGAKRPPSKNQGPSIRETDVTTETPSDDIKHGAADNEAFLQSHDDVKTKRPFSAGSRHSTVTAVVEENRLPKVEN